MEFTPAQEAKMSSRTFTVRGHKIRTTSNRRYAVVAAREEAITAEVWNGFEDGRVIRRHMGRSTAEWWVGQDVARSISPERVTYVAFAEIIKRSDSYATAVKVKESRVGNHGPGTVVVVVDTDTGQEV
jgi:hypothetical protein